MKILRTILLLLGLPTLVFSQSHYTNTIGMEFVRIEPGTMVVGRFQPTTTEFGFLEEYIRQGAKIDLPKLPAKYFSEAENLARRDSRPGFAVTIPKAYYMGKFEVTQGQWKKVIGSNPSYFQGNHVEGNSDDYPVESVTWEDAQLFVRKLNQLEKGKRRYRLPTEFEWEYAARAGATDDISWKQINETAQIALKTTKPVGKKQPNAWGIYDMLGNVWEWTLDYYNEKIFADPVPPKRGKEHVLKGAPFYGDVKNATYMTHAAGPGSQYDVGLRIVMESEDKH